MHSSNYIAASTPVLPAELVYQVISHLKAHDKALNNCALACSQTNHPARAVQFQKCHVTLESYDTFMKDVLTPRGRTFPLSVVRKIKLSRLSTEQLETLLALAHEFQGVNALDLHFLDWAIDPKLGNTTATTLRWVTKLHITCVGFPSMDSFSHLVASFPSLSQLKVYMPHSDDSGSSSVDEQRRTYRPVGCRRQLAQLQLLAVDTRFVDCLLSLFIVERIVLFGGSREGVWDLLEERVNADETAAFEFSHCEDIFLNQGMCSRFLNYEVLFTDLSPALLDVPRSPSSPQQVRYHFVINDSSIFDLFLPGLMASFCQDPAARLPLSITLAFEIKLYGTAINSALVAICEAPWKELDALLTSKNVANLVVQFHLDQEEGASEYLQQLEDGLRQQMKAFTEQGSLAVASFSP
jgi:hypothetical protein